MLDPLPDDYVSAPKDPDFPFARQIAFRVGGDSMNRARPKPIIEGDVIVCVLWEDLGIEITDGMNVVVQREMDGGHLVERSVKEVRVTEGGYEFLPRSSNSAYQPFRVAHDLSADDGKQVLVLALVRFVFDHQPLPVTVRRLTKAQ
ncbi:MAG TPA: hypothetical protein VHL98_10945 [Microvirga sp.]|nr:hypothetical protein [Microvirga sp.]